MPRLAKSFPRLNALHASCLWGASLLNIDTISNDDQPKQFHYLTTSLGGLLTVWPGP